VSEFVELPNTWAFAPLSSIADVNPRSFCPLPSAVSQPVHFVPMSAVTEEFGGIDISARRPLGDVQKGYTSFLTNDVLLAKITPCMENGKLALVPPLQDHLAFGSTEFHVLRAKDQVQPSWLAYFLSQSAFRRLARQNMTGSAGQLRVATTWLSDALIPVAPATEQTRIVAKLEELLSDLDAGVAELKAAQKKLAQYRQSLLKAAVEGALTAAWRTQHQPTETGAQLLQRILQERRARWEARQLAKFAEQGKTPPKDWQKKYPEPVQPDTTDLPELPQGWVWATIDQIAQVGTGVTPLRSKSAYFNEGTIPWVTSGALNSEAVASATELVTELALKECRLELYPVGSLLVAMYGEGKTRGKCSELRIPATINQAIAAIVLEPAAQSCKAYLKAFLLDSYEKMRAQASGGVQPNLNLQIVKAIALPLPPCSEQAEITQLLDGQFDQISQQQIAVQVSLQQSTAQRQNILRAAFSGQLVPQDPHDEPASALLERIRAERAARDAVKKPRGRKAQEAA
jgi:type I restriction enzyme S subunit